MSQVISKFIFIFLIIFTPLAFGTVEPWSYAIMEILTAFALLLFFLSVIRKDDELYKVPGIIPLILLLSYVLFQLIPLPPEVVKFLSPTAYDIQLNTNIFTNVQTMTLSLNSKATLSEFFRYSTYVMFYVLTVQHLKDKVLLRNTALIITLFGGLLAFSSILQFYLTDHMALWFRHSPNNSIIVGPYINHNHYAGLMEMIFPIVLALFFFYRPRIKNTSLFKGVAEILSHEKANIHILIGTAALLIITSIFVSLSRSAMICTFFSLILFTFLLIRRNVSKGNTIMIVGVIMMTALCIGWFGWDQIFERFAKLKNAQGIIHETRFDFWQDSKKMLDDYKIAGSGFGTFIHTYPSYRTLKAPHTLTHAHNDYMELISEGGIIAFTLLALFFIVFIYRTYTQFSKRKQAIAIYLYMGSITSILAMLLHSFTDFNTHIGANGLWFFFVMGFAVSAVFTNFRKFNFLTRLPEVTSKLKKWTAFFIVLILFLATVGYNLSHLIGLFYFSNIKEVTLNADTPSKALKK
ncbi:MAG: O-antigen ligase family protein, partial [Desulfobacteraceae bacterium]|nr:O-antigen ligase family protein [Desulfobacteraceae bacterium]